MTLPAAKTAMSELKEKTMNEPSAWAVVTAKGLANVCLLQAVANDWASHHGGEVIPLFAKDKDFCPAQETTPRLLEAIQDFIDQTDPWLRQITDGQYKIHTPEHRNARRALKELRKRLASELPSCR